MNKKIIGILVLMLMIATTVLPVVGIMNINIATNLEKNSTRLNIEEQNENQVLTSDITDKETSQAPLYDYISGNGTTDYIPKFTDTTTIGNSVIYENDGEIGIGTTSPLYPLTVKGVIASFPSGNNGLVFAGYSNGGGQITTQKSDGFFNNIFIKWGQTSFNGNVEMEHLHVIAPYDDTAIRGSSSGWAGYFEGKSYFSDNVGIGTTNPSYLLDVSGGSDIVAKFSGRVKGAKAVDNDEFVIKSQVKALVKEQLQSILQKLNSPLARNFINYIEDQSISNPFESLMKTHYTPTGTNDVNGNIGDITYDDSYIYIKTNEGWKRTSLETW